MMERKHENVCGVVYWLLKNIIASEQAVPV